MKNKTERICLMCGERHHPNYRRNKCSRCDCELVDSMISPTDVETALSFRNEVASLELRLAELAANYQLLVAGNEDLNQENQALAVQLRRRQQEIVAIQTGIKNEFKLGKHSGDVLQDFQTFIEHHNVCEQELTTLRNRELVLMEALNKLACLGNGDKHGNSDGNCIAIKTLSLLAEEKNNSK